jgi:hypothetical protein
LARNSAASRLLRDEVQGGDQKAGLKLLRSLPHGHVAAALGMLPKVGLDGVLSQGGRQPARGGAVHRHDGGAPHRSVVQAGDGAPARCRDCKLFSGPAA